MFFRKKLHSVKAFFFTRFSNLMLILKQRFMTFISFLKIKLTDLMFILKNKLTDLILQFYKHLKSFIIKHVFFIFSFSLLLICMVVISPLTTLYILLLLSLICLYRGKYKDIFYLWAFYFFSWYVLFAVFLLGFECNILFEKNYSNLVLGHLAAKCLKYPLFETFCIESWLICHVASNYFGVPFFIPILPFRGLFLWFKRLFGGNGTATCSPGSEDKKISSIPTPKPDAIEYPSPGISPSDIGGPFFKSSTIEIEDTPIAPVQPEKTSCDSAIKALNESMGKSSMAGVKVESGDDGGSRVVAKLQVPFVPEVGSITVCGEFKGYGFKKFNEALDEMKKDETN